MPYFVTYTQHMFQINQTHKILKFLIVQLILSYSFASKIQLKKFKDQNLSILFKK